MSELPVSVVIATIGRVSLVADLVASIRAGDDQPDEVLVVVQSRNVSTREALGALEHVTLVPSPPQGLSAARNHGAREVYVCATHAVLCDNAVQRLQGVQIRQIALTDSIPLPPEKQLPNIVVLSVAELLADAIKRIHNNQSVSALFN